MAILRSVGAGPGTVIGLLVAEAVFLTALGVLAGVALTYVSLMALQSVIDRIYGIHIGVDWPGAHELKILAGVAFGGTLAGLVPALRAYRLSLADGMMVRN
jgi:putative ABC transport system permease protein